MTTVLTGPRCDQKSQDCVYRDADVFRTGRCCFSCFSSRTGAVPTAGGNVCLSLYGGEEVGPFCPGSIPQEHPIATSHLSIPWENPMAASHLSISWEHPNASSQGSIPWEHPTPLHSSLAWCRVWTHEGERSSGLSVWNFLPITTSTPCTVMIYFCKERPRKCSQLNS